ncbi:DsbA family protein [Patescibacteria group bacterium]|nr:DsbA family protein [Patescibacteria group bacterium]
MSDKKIIVVAIILSALVIGGGWYYSKNSPQQAAISQPQKTAAVISEAGISFGDPNAAVTIEEYTNFLCPACARFATETFGKIKDAYVATGKVKFVFFFYPPFELGEATLCAQEQNKFIEYHDYLFNHQGQITDEDILKDFATNVGMDLAKFNECYASDRYDGKLQKWLDEGQAREVDATPTFFINGQKFIGAQPYEEFQKIIDQKLNQ